MIFGSYPRKMRHKGNISEVKKDRDKHIKRLFQEIKRSRTCATIGEICRKIANTHMDRFYISEERGSEIYYQYVRNGKISANSPYAYRMHECFVEACEAVKKKKGIACIRHIAREAVDYPARCLGLSPNRIQKILKEGGLI